MEEYQDSALTQVNRDKTTLIRKPELLDISFSRTKSNEMIAHIATMLKIIWKDMELKPTNRQWTFDNKKIVINFKTTSLNLKEDTIPSSPQRKSIEAAHKICSLPQWNLAIQQCKIRIVTLKELKLNYKI